MNSNNITMSDDAVDHDPMISSASGEKIYSIQKLSDFKDPILQIVREMGIEKFGDDQVRGMYIFGSQAYYSQVRDAGSIEPSGVTDSHGNELIGVCWRNDEKKEVIQYLAESDFDIILVVDEYKSTDELLGALASDMQSKWETQISIKTCLGEDIEFKLDVSVYNTSYFISYMHYHQPVYNQAVTSHLIDQVYVIYEDEKMSYFRKNWCIHHLNIPRLINANAEELDYCFQKAKRFFELAQNGSYSDERENYQDVYTGYLSRRPTQALLKTSKKNIVHGKRKLLFSRQLMENNEITDYQEMNDFQDHVLSFPNHNWDVYEQNFLPEYDQLKVEFTDDCDEVIAFGKKLLERQKDVINFLNKFCITDNLSKLRASFRNESKHIEKNKISSIESYVANLFMNGIYVLKHLFGIRVVPFEASNNSEIENATLFQCSIPPNVDNLHPHLMALDGCIIKFDKYYSMVSQTCGRTVDLRDSSILPRFDDYLYCFKVPCGKSVSLFHYNNEWKVSCPELDNQDWIDWPLLKKKGANWREDFWRVWKQQNLSLDELNKKSTIMFIWNGEQLTMIGQYGADESIFRFLDKPNIIQEKELTSYVQDGFSLKKWKQAMIEESLKLNPKEYSGFLFMQDNGQVVYHLASPLHYLIPRLKLANKFYSGVDVLNKDVIEKCTDSTLLQNSDNDRIVISCAALADHYEGSLVEDCFKLINPVFRCYYLMIRNELLKEENKEHIPLIKEAALTLDYSPQVVEIIEDVYYNAESLDYFDTMTDDN